MALSRNEWCRGLQESLEAFALDPLAFLPTNPAQSLETIQKMGYTATKSSQQANSGW